MLKDIKSSATKTSAAVVTAKKLGVTQYAGGISLGRSLLVQHRRGDMACWTGYCVTPHGVVGVTKVVHDKHPAQDSVHLVLARGGREHSRTYWHAYSTRYILTLAQRFAIEIEKAAEKSNA